MSAYEVWKMYCAATVEPEYDRETRAAALEAANRIMHGAGTENDYQLVAGVLFELLSSCPE